MSILSPIYRYLLGIFVLVNVFFQAAIAEPVSIQDAVKNVNKEFKNMQVEAFEWPDSIRPKLGELKSTYFVATHKQSAGGKRPLVISLHGGGGKNWNVSEQLARSSKVKGLAFAEKANQDLILFEPNSFDSWDPVTLNYALEAFLKQYPSVDKNRIYLIGHSMGGTGILAWSLTNPELFAAVSPSGFRLKEPLGSLENLIGLPIWLTVGAEDGVRPDDVLGVYTELKKLGHKQVGYTAFPGANHPQANAAVFSSVDTIEWFLSHSKDK